MATIAELTPIIAEANNPDYPFVNGVWNSRDATLNVATERGHSYRSLPAGPVTQAQLEELLTDADALIFAATNGASPRDGEAAGRALATRLLAQLGSRRPDLHVVYFSNFLVGHGLAHRNAKAQHRAFRAVEAQLRAGGNRWTILRQTWIAQVHDGSYQTRLTQDPHADGFSTTRSIADAIVAAIENPGTAAGRTASVFTLSIPDNGTTDLPAQLAALEPDFEAQFVPAVVTA